MLDIQITRTTAPKPLPDPDKLVFGRTFTDHMFLMNYDAGQGWHDPRVVPYGPLPFELSCMVFHYAQEIFEGMKAYRTADNTEETPWMLHRAIFGSIERVLGILIEHYAGALPLWLAPVQVVVIPIADRHKEAAAEFAGQVKGAGGRVEVYDQNEPMRVKIAKAQAQKIPYMIVMGDAEIEEGVVSVRERAEGDLGKWDRERFLSVIREAAL